MIVTKAHVNTVVRDKFNQLYLVIGVLSNGGARMVRLTPKTTLHVTGPDLSIMDTTTMEPRTWQERPK